MKYKLVCFDVDGTLVDNLKFSWQVFHDHFQTDGHIREGAKKRFFSRKISYKEWAEHDIQMWIDKKATRDGFFEAMEKSGLKVMEGALETIKELKSKGIKLAIVSGSISIVLEKFFPDYEEIFDDVFISRLYFGENGQISKVEATEFDMEKKAEALRKICDKEGIKLEESVFVGDFENDVKICEEAGLGIAFNCKSDKLKKVADVVIGKKDLREILRYIV